MRFDYLAFILAALDLSTACECPSELPFCYTDGYCYNDQLTIPVRAGNMVPPAVVVEPYMVRRGALAATGRL